MIENSNPKAVWITGNSGAGKTFTGDYLRINKKFIHIDGEQGWASKDERKSKIFFDCVEAFDNWFEGKEAPDELWHPYINYLIEEAKEEVSKGNNVVVTFTVYHRQVRDFLRNHLPELIFVHLVCSKQELINRAKTRFENYASGIDKTVKEAFEANYKMEYSDENFEKVNVQILRGIMDLQEDEISTGYYLALNVDDGISYLKTLCEKLMTSYSDNDNFSVETIA